MAVSICSLLCAVVSNKHTDHDPSNFPECAACFTPLLGVLSMVACQSMLTAVGLVPIHRVHALYQNRAITIELNCFLFAEVLALAIDCAACHHELRFSPMCLTNLPLSPVIIYGFVLRLHLPRITNSNLAKVVERVSGQQIYAHWRCVIDREMKRTLAAVNGLSGT